MPISRVLKAFESHTPDLKGSRGDFGRISDKVPSNVPDNTPGTVQGQKAAVLVPIFNDGGILKLVLTRRSDDLTKHAGQVSFPGGTIDPDDAGAKDAALRETFEETGIESKYIEIIGRLDTYHTITGFDVTPVVGLLKPGFSVVAEPGEVAEVFFLPLDFVLETENIREEVVEYSGKRRRYFAMNYRQHYIWGATAAMLVNLVEVLENSR